MVHVIFWISSYTNEIIEKSPQQQIEGNERMSHLKSSTHQITELQKINIIGLPWSPP